MFFQVFTDGHGLSSQNLHEHCRLNDHIGQAGIHQRLFHRLLSLVMGHIGQQGMQHRVKCFWSIFSDSKQAFDVQI